MPGLEKKLARRHAPAEPQSMGGKVHLSLLSLYVAEGEVDEFQCEYNKEVNAQRDALHRRCSIITVVYLMRGKLKWKVVF